MEYMAPLRVRPRYYLKDYLKDRLTIFAMTVVNVDVTWKDPFESILIKSPEDWTSLPK